MKKFHFINAETVVLPLIVNVSNHTVLVIGGGKIGRRKAVVLMNAGAKVRIVEPSANILNMPNGADVIAETYQECQMEGVLLVVAAAPPSINEQVVADAKRRRIPVCDVSRPEISDFHFPAVHRQGDLMIAVSTSGAAPALAKHIRDRLAEDYGTDYENLISVLAEVRNLVLNSALRPEQRASLLSEFADIKWLAQLRENGRDFIKNTMLNILDQHIKKD